MGVALILLGYFVGSFFYPGRGRYFRNCLCAVYLVCSVDNQLFCRQFNFLSVSNAREVTPDVHQQLFNVVEEMQIAANLPKMPKVYIIDEAAPNAFATGIKPENSAITVTAGLLSKLNRDELQGVIAHEMSHIVNRDILVMTFAGIMLGSIVLISEIFLKDSGSQAALRVRYRSRSSSDSGQGQIDNNGSCNNLCNSCSDCRTVVVLCNFKEKRIPRRCKRCKAHPLSGRIGFSTRKNFFNRSGFEIGK